MRFKRHPEGGLRWWEVRLLEFLAKSPRINRILVEVFPPDDDVDDDRHEADLRQQLEALYHSPSAWDEYREG